MLQKITNNGTYYIWTFHLSPKIHSLKTSGSSKQKWWIRLRANADRTIGDAPSKKFPSLKINFLVREKKLWAAFQEFELELELNVDKPHRASSFWLRARFHRNSNSPNPNQHHRQFRAIWLIDAVTGSISSKVRCSLVRLGKL